MGRAAAVAKRILVVEDNPQLSAILRMAFEFQGYDVTVADNGQEALEACHDRQERYDALVMDLQMPVMDGITAARALRAHPATHEALLICLSANIDTVENPDELKVLFDELLRKPVSPRDLVTRVTALLAERAGTPSSASAQS